MVGSAGLNTRVVSGATAEALQPRADALVDSRKPSPVDTLEIGSFAARPAPSVPQLAVAARLTEAQASEKIRALLAPKLRGFLGDIDVASRTANTLELQRIIERTLPNIGNIEEVHGNGRQEVVNKKACGLLYNANFKGDEAEDLSVIQQRRVDMERLGNRAYRKTNPAEWKELADRYGDSRFHHVAITDKEGHVIAQRQFSVVPVGDDGVAIFTQYTSVANAEQVRDIRALKGASSNDIPEDGARRMGCLTLLHALSIAIAERDAQLTGRTKVAATYFESEMKGQGSEPGEIAFTRERLLTHNKVGSKVMMLEMADGSLMTPHCQPALGDEASAMLLHFMVRVPKYEGDDISKTVRWETPEEMATARGLADSFFENFKREGFPAEDVEAARSMIMARFDACRRVVLLAPDDVPNMIELAKHDPVLARQVEETYGPADKHAALMRECGIV